MEGDCHYLEGNLNAKRRVKRIKELLAQIGIEPERVGMFNLSSAMAGQFATITIDMNETVKTLGPNPLKSTDQNENNLDDINIHQSAI